MFAVLRFVTGIGIGGLLATTAALVAEVVPAAKKNLYNAIVYSGVPAGGILASVLAIALRDVAHPAFPGLTTGTSEGDQTVVRWRECDWVFQNGTLVEIRPLGSTSATVDGITVGTPMTRVVELFGQPVRDDTASSTAYFAADKARGTALRIGCQGSVADGTVRSIVLCRCLPDESSGAPTGNSGVATKTELCAANKKVADIFTGPVNIINDVGGTQYLELVENLGRVAQRYPNEAVQYEGGQLVELAQGGVVTLDQYYSKQNIRAACRG